MSLVLSFCFLSFVSLCWLDIIISFHTLTLLFSPPFITVSWFSYSHQLHTCSLSSPHLHATSSPLFLVWIVGLLFDPNVCWIAVVWRLWVIFPPVLFCSVLSGPVCLRGSLPTAVLYCFCVTLSSRRRALYQFHSSRPLWVASWGPLSPSAELLSVPFCVKTFSVHSACEAVIHFLLKLWVFSATYSGLLWICDTD